LVSIPGAEPLVEASGPDKVVHFALFAILGLLWATWLPHRKRTIVAAGIAYGLALELYQGCFIAGRNCSLDDAVADTVGIILGTALVVGLDRWNQKRTPESSASTDDSVRT